MRYYVLCIYRGSDGAEPPALAGAVEHISGDRWTFGSADELVRILERDHEERRAAPGGRHGI